MLRVVEEEPPPLQQSRVLTVHLPGLPLLVVVAVPAAVVRRGPGRMTGEVAQPLRVAAAVVVVAASTLLSPMEPLACPPMASQPCPLQGACPLRCLGSSSPFWACLGATPR